MDVSASDPKGLLQLPTNRRATQPGDYELLISALQYSLQNSILIGSQDDIKCLGGIAVEPYVHQVETLIQFLNNYPQRMMLLDEVGLGKTISAGLILAELIRRRRISNFLVVCPAILVDQWHQELTEKFRFRDLRFGNWQHIQPWVSLEPETLKVITTYNAVVNHRDVFLNRKWDFVIADEGDYLKTLYSANGLEPSARARTFYDLLKEGRADFFLLLTATPLRRNLWDVFNLTELTCQPGINPIGTPQSFKRMFIADDPTTAMRIRESQHGEFRRRLMELAVRNSRRGQTGLTFPKRQVAPFAVPLSTAKGALLDSTLDYLRQRYNLLRKIELEQVERLVAIWKQEIERRQPRSWDQLSLVSDEVTRRLGEYEFNTTSASGEPYRTTLSYEYVIQALLAFVEQDRHDVAFLNDPEKVCRFLATDLPALVKRFFEKEVKRRRPNKLEEISLLQSVLSSPAAGAEAFRKKRQKGSLTKYEQDTLDALIGRAEAIREPEKAKQLLRLALKLREERPQDYRLLVFTIRRATQEFLGEYLETNGFKDEICYIRGGCPKENRRSQLDFNGIELKPGFGLPRKHILISTDAGSAGINLQACNTMVNYDLPWVAMTIEQRIGRIQRLGQIAAHVIVNNFYIAQTIDETIVMRLWERIRLFELAIGELEAILKEADGEEERDLEEQIFELIMLSKERRDEEVAHRLEQMNRDEAIRLLRAEQAQNEELLGKLLSTKGTPRFTPRPPAPPRLDVRIFCRGAFERLGFRTEYHSDRDLLYVDFKKPTDLLEKWRRYTFSEPDAPEDGEGVEGIRLLAEGTKDFEAILREMRNRGGIVVRSCEPLERIGEEECLQILGTGQGDGIHPDRLMSHQESTRIAWRLTWKVAVAVARDRFEKLMTEFLPGEDDAAAQRLKNLPTDQLEGLPLSLSPVAGRQPPDKAVVPDHLRACVQADEDIRAFEEHYTLFRKDRIIQLKEWFDGRRREEGIFPDPELQQERTRRMEEVEKQLTPSAQADLVIVEGFVYRTLKGEVECTVERDGRRQHVAVGYEWIPLTRLGRLNLECRECRREIPSQFEVCAEGHLVCTDHLARCAHPGCQLQTCRRCASARLKQCGVSGVHVCGEHLQACPSCGGEVLVDLLFEVENTEEPVCPNCFEVCEATGRPHLLSELERSDLSGKLVYHRLLHTCPVTGKLGLAEEMEPEAGTEILYAPEALETCEVSRARVRPEKLARSGISGKLCLPEYLERCEVSGVLGLPDELDVCAETEQRVDRRLLTTCAVCGGLALRTVLRVSPVSGQLFHERCGVACEVTGDPCLPGEIAASAVSGRKVRRDRLVASEWSQRLGLPEESLRCEVSGELLLRDEAVQCEETGRVLSPRLIATCAVTGKQVYKEELTTCKITRQLVLRRLLEPSAVSGELGLRELMERDEVDGSYALPGELETCAATGKRVTPRKLVTCPDTDRRFLEAYGKRCAKTRVLVHPEALAASAASGLLVRRSILINSEVSDLSALPEELRTCAVSKKRVLPDELARCDVSGLDVLPELLSPCPICTRRSITKRRKSCRGCFGRYCPACILENLCQTCRSIGPPLRPLESLETALREAVLQIFSAVGRVSMARNDRWILVYAKPRATRFWEASRLLVFEERDGAYVLYRSNHEFSLQ